MRKQDHVGGTDPAVVFRDHRAKRRSASLAHVQPGNPRKLGWKRSQLVLLVQGSAFANARETSMERYSVKPQSGVATDVPLPACLHF